MATSDNLSPTSDRPASHDLYHAAVAARVEITPLRSVLKSADLDPNLRVDVLTSLRRLEEQLEKALKRFEKEEDLGEVHAKRYENALATFGSHATSENTSFEGWRTLYGRILRHKFGEEVEAPDDALLRNAYLDGLTPLEALESPSDS